MYFHNAEVGDLLEEITDPMVIIIRVVGLIAECFYFFKVSTLNVRWLHMEGAKKPPIVIVRFHSDYSSQFVKKIYSISFLQVETPTTNLPI